MRNLSDMSDNLIVKTCVVCQSPFYDEYKPGVPTCPKCSNILYATITREEIDALGKFIIPCIPTGHIPEEHIHTIKKLVRYYVFKEGL